ncbi:MAG: carboxypeptidase regulatory-like domain-containing protein [Armatimonadetes bacterium]|nr:carboxypeptidase regulatory-like domain-containing protein [Armatimonadota bacterium]
MRNLPILRAMCALMLAALTAASTTASNAQLTSGFPDANPRSGRFINVTRGLSSIGEAGTHLGITCPAGAAQLKIGVFDGDLGGKWDPVNSLTVDTVRFALYADPSGVMAATPDRLVGEWFSTAMPDDAWFDIAVPNVTAALTTSGVEYRYYLAVTWQTTGQTDEQNNFKVRTNGVVFAKGNASFGFIGYGPVDPTPSLFPNTTYTGAWSFNLDVKTAPTSIALWNGDFDRADDTSDPNSPSTPGFPVVVSANPEKGLQPQGARTGAPADDAPSGSLLRISPAIGQSFTAPDGAWTVTDPNPSGDKEWELLSVRLDTGVAGATYANPTAPADADWKVPSMPAGLYRWQIIGADGRNTLFLHPEYDLYGMSQVGDFVWDDVNANGIQDAGEAGVGGVTVSLLDATFAVIATTTTNATGAYLFDNLVPGAYSVRFSLPAGYVFTVAGAGTNPEANSHADLQTGATDAVILAAGQSAFFLDAGLVRPASVGDYVWEDMNYNGVQDAGEPGVSGVKVELLTSAGEVQATATTATGGLYSFTGLVPGTYSVRFEPPIGYQFTQPATDPDSAIQSHADAITGATELREVPAGGSITILDAGLVRVAALGDRVWVDANRNGTQDTDEVGLAGVAVRLMDADGVVLAADTTGTDGRYLFSDLAPGVYKVAFTAPAGYTFTAQAAGTDPEADSDADTATGISGSVTLVSGESVTSVDAGLIGPASLGDKVWLDTDKDGIQDAGETGVAGVTVKLLSATDAVLTSVVTDADGEYLFSDLAPGTYRVQFVLPTNHTFTLKGVGSDTEADSDADTTSGMTAAVTLAAGDNVTSVDAGLKRNTCVRPASLGDRVWLDADKDGIQDSCEVGVAGVTVKLLDTSDTVLATTVTGSTGRYLFGNLAPGSYKVQFVLPANYTFTLKGVGSNRAVDSDADTATGVTAVVTLASGDSVTYVDAGLKRSCVRPASLGDRVWLDADKDGVQDSCEVGVAGVTVKLLGSDDEVLATTVTSSTGGYLFNNLAPGTYKVQFILPADYAFTLKGVGSNRAVDSDADRTTGVTGAVVLASGDNVTSVDAGLKRTTCTHRYTTYTQGGWGAKPSGNNPGALLAAKFCRVYGSCGVTIGGCKTLRFTSASAIEAFLPQGGTARALSCSAVNPTGQLGVLAGQVLAMRLNIDFSAAGITQTGLGSLRIQSGAFGGLTVTQFAAIANKALGGGGTSGYTMSQINDAATAINENFDNGTTDNGFLK